jgi:hypothetical protein
VLSAGSSHGQVLTIAQGIAVLNTLWNARERAAAMLNVAMLERLETGSALLADVGFARAERSAGRGSQRPTRSADWENIVVPKQRGYPAWFMARGHVGMAVTPADPVTSDGLEEILILRKAAPAETWRLAVEVTFDPALTRAAVVGTREPGIGPSPPGRARGANELRDLAAYYQYWHERGSPPPKNEFAPGPGTATEGVRIARELPNIRNIRGTAYPRAADVFTVPLDDGWTLACGGVHSWTIDSRATSRGFLWQPSDRSNWGDGVKPGAYGAIASRAVRQVCIARRGRHTPMVVYGGLPALITQRTSPVSPSPTGATGPPARD